jgi:predicted N-formylglutamate amidohydrolase
VTIDLLKDAYSWLKREAAPGVDGRTWQSYKENLEVNLRELHARIHQGTYRALPSRRRYIPKPDGRQRPLGIAALEDKIAQRAVVEMLNAIYEEDSKRLEPNMPYRGRDAHYWAPPAQIPAGVIHAPGSHLGYLTAKRSLGQG